MEAALPGAGTYMKMQDKKKTKEAAEALFTSVSEKFDADIFVLNAPMDGGNDSAVIEAVTRRNRKNNVLVYLVTEGGSADIAYRIARCFQASYENFTVVVNGWCKSAGTLICIGANNLLIGDMGELGPLDVQIVKPDEIISVSSGLTIDSSFRSLQSAAFQMFESCLLDILSKSGGRITTKAAAELAVELSVGLFSPIYQQLDPAKIGEDYRSTRIAEQYALRLNAHAQNLKEEMLDPIEALVRGYPSHGFVIDRTEASSLFERVEPLTEGILEIAALLGHLSSRPQQLDQSFMQYLNTEKIDEKGVNEGEGEAKSSSDKKRAGAGKERRDLQADTHSGDGIVTAAVADNAPRTAQKNANSN